MNDDLLDIGNGLNPFEQMNKKIDTVHIRFQQRTARKGTTIVEGLCNQEADDDLNKKILKTLSKTLRKKLSCSCAVKYDKQRGFILQLAGDHREKIKEFLIENGDYEKEYIKLHGF